MQIICDKKDLMQTTSSIFEKFKSDMKRSGLRVTHVRLTLFSILNNSNRPLSIQELVEKAPNSHFVSVYRSIDALQKAEIVKQVPQGFKNLFELSESYKPHHHHASCEICNKSIAIDDPELENLLTKIATRVGLTPTKHTFELIGICQACMSTKS